MKDDAARTELPPVSPRRWVRGARIGTSVLFEVLTVVMVVLWLRNCRVIKTYCFGVRGYECTLTFDDKKIELYAGKPTLPPWAVPGNFFRGWTSHGIYPNYHKYEIDLTTLGFFYHFGAQISVVVPNWFPIALSVIVTTVSVIPIPRRSLRSMLIATAILALALVVVLNRSNDSSLHSATQLSVVEIKAIDTARLWVQQNLEPSTFEYRTVFEDDGWSVYIESIPRIPRLYWVLRYDENDKNPEVWNPP
jgi:hypothetical protein